MNSVLRIVSVLLCLWSSSRSFATEAKIEHLRYKYGNFGEVTALRISKSPSRLILFAGGNITSATQKAAALAKIQKIVDDKTAVAIFDSTKLIDAIGAGKSKCLYPAGDLELLSKFLQTKLKFSHYDVPRLIGFDQGANLA